LRVDADHPLSVEFSRLMIPYAKQPDGTPGNAGTIDQTPARPDASVAKIGQQAA
jgi:hypothetical protein